MALFTPDFNGQVASLYPDPPLSSSSDSPIGTMKTTVPNLGAVVRIA